MALVAVNRAAFSAEQELVPGLVQTMVAVGCAVSASASVDTNSVLFVGSVVITVCVVATVVVVVVAVITVASASWFFAVKA